MPIYQIIGLKLKNEFNRYQNKYIITNILIIGGSGLGSHVADQLTLNNHKVTIFDKKESKWIKNQKFIKGDILDSTKLDQAIKNQDVVYNFAGVSDLNEAIKKPEKQ